MFFVEYAKFNFSIIQIKSRTLLQIYLDDGEIEISIFNKKYKIEQRAEKQKNNSKNFQRQKLTNNHEMQSQNSSLFRCNIKFE